MDFRLTAGQCGDVLQAKPLLSERAAKVVLADTAYDADWFRAQIDEMRAKAVIPNNPSRALKYVVDRALYKERHLVECCFEKLKRFRRVATRYEKTERNFRAVILIAATMLWLQ